MKSPVVVVVLLALTACDLAQPFEGPGYVLGEGLTSDAPGPFVASSTLLQIDDTPEAKAAFDAHMNEIDVALPQQAGLIGKSLASSVDGYRTLSVWEDEEAVLGWVVNDAHVAAMQDMADKTKRAVAVSWTMERAELEQAPPSWEDAKRRLDDDGHSAY